MVIDREFFSLNDIAKLCETSNSNVSNWRKRDSRFPIPYQETSAGPIWKAEDIVQYLQNKNEFDVISSPNLKSKRVAVIGRARGGKSFLISRFVSDRNGFIELFCGNNSDKTACPIYVKISEIVLLESYKFHTDFNQIYRDENLPSIISLKEKVSKLVGHSYQQEDKAKMIEIEETIKCIKKIQNQFPNKKQCQAYIETYQKPSIFCKELLRECELGSVEIIDTPGVSGNVEASKISKSDLYLFLIKPDNEYEAQTLKKIVTEIKSDVATSKVGFLYKKEGILLTQKKYDDARVAVKKDMSAYTSLFEDLKGSIVSTELDVLNPADHCILFPTMDSEDVTLPEELFLQDMYKKLISAFKPENEANITHKFNVIMDEKKEEAKKFILSLMENIPAHQFLAETNLYTIDTFISEQHDRVMTKDNYRLHNDLFFAYTQESQKLYNYFSKFTVVDFPEEWQQILLKLVYKILITSVRTDRGLGVGTHPWEENPARTMLVEESLLADRVLENISGKEDWMTNLPYRNALKNCNITSKTWNYVGCNNDKSAVLKLNIISNYLIPVPVSSRKEMVLCRYIGGLRKIAQYRVLSLMGFTHSDCMVYVGKFPF